MTLDMARRVWYREYIKTPKTQQQQQSPNNSIQEWVKDLNRPFPTEDIWLSYNYIKRCSRSLVTKEIKIKTTGRCHFTPKLNGYNKYWKVTSDGEDVQKLEASYSTGWNVKRCSHVSEQCDSSSEIKHSLTNSTPRYIHSEELKTESNRYLHMKVHSSFAHSNQNIETVQMSFDG